MKTILHLPLKRQYFEEIRDGVKLEEYRICNTYWAKRLEGREYEKIVLALGYPRREAHELRIACAWNGYTVKTITHPHFGPDPVQVYAIDVSQRL